MTITSKKSSIQSTLPEATDASIDLGAPAEQGEPDQAGNSLGTTPSNTVPSTSINNPKTKILRTGVDSLYLSFLGELSEVSSNQLDKLKLQAQSPVAQTASLAQLQLDSHLFEVGDKGRSIYSYVLRDNWYQIQVSKKDAKNKPLAFALISSGLLSTQSLPFIINDLKSCISALGSIEDNINLSRLDICADFITDFPMNTLMERQWVTRSRVCSRHTESGNFTGFSIGMGGDLSARLYDKTLEMKRKLDRPYLKELWAQSGWNGTDKVWRLEFQFKRAVLNQFGVSTYADLDGSLLGLWHYATQDWLRLTAPSTTDKTQSRWPSIPLWETLQNATWSGDPALQRINIEKARLPSDKSLFENGLAAITSFMAKENINDLYRGVKEYIKAAELYHHEQKKYTGLDVDEYVDIKVKFKQRKYNTAFNVQPDTTSDAYRRARDGE